MVIIKDFFLNETKTNLKCIIRNIDITLMNSLRRICISEIPSMSIDFVMIKKNSSNMNEEFLSHRLSLLPIISQNIEKMKYQEECDCFEGCKFCETVFSLKKNEAGPVYCSDILYEEGEQSNKILTYRQNYLGIHLLTLEKGEEIDIICKAIKGVGKEHSKWSSVNICRVIQGDDIVFELECNQNMNVFHILKSSILILEAKFKLLKQYVMKNKIWNNPELPFCDTVMNILTKTIHQTFEEIDMCFYKRSHFLKNEQTSMFTLWTTLENKDEIVLESINIILSQLQLLESELNVYYYGINIPNTKFHHRLFLTEK